MTQRDLELVDFQLYLLKTMQPPEFRLAAALRELDSTAEDMLARSEAVAEATRFGTGSSQRIVSALSEALLDESVGANSDELTYRLPLWPKFNFILSFNNPLPLIKRGEFVRPAGLPAEGKVTSWSLLESEMVDMFDQICEVDAWGHYRTYTARDQRRGERHFLRFGWGLLQEAEILEE